VTPQSDEVCFHSIQQAFQPDEEHSERERLGNTFEVILFSLCVVVLALVVYSILGGAG
jgi:hypothetical protein